MRRRITVGLILTGLALLEGCTSSSDMPSVPPPPPAGTVQPAPTGTGVLPKPKSGKFSNKPAASTPNAL